MNLLERYIWKSVALSIVGTWFLLTLLVAFFAFLGELGDIDPNTNYGTIQALIYIAYGIPKTLYEFFPTATLIGTLLGLGSLSTTHELTAMRAAGLSIGQIVGITLRLGLVLVVITIILGEWITPKANIAAQTFKSEQLQQKVAVNAKGIWVKQGAQMVRIQQVWSTDLLEGVTIYSIDLAKGQLSQIETIAKASYQQGVWQFQDIHTQLFKTDAVEYSQTPERQVSNFISPDTLTIATLRPQQLAATELADFIAHQQANDLNSAPYELAYWTHFTNPFATLVMILLAAPLVFGSQRSAGTGQRVFIGILMGLGFYLLNRIAGNSSLVYGLPPLFAAVAPLLAFLLLGLLLLRRVR
ncbi:LPS export ABC transporter permease LptG [Thiofilum flexile]|uniref:LPS export ABC transporter permease LptG n=1 Tax=Thiofilum flexile TaxID=125627 RepID=UPI00036B73D3|nr:LPS export ABC transporter permease LptG [Thiofilum flexile]